MRMFLILFRNIAYLCQNNIDSQSHAFIQDNQMKLPSIAALAVLFSPTILYSQTVAPSATAGDGVRIDRNIFNHLDVGLSLGSAGIGLDLSTNVTDWVRLRAGVDYMPEFAVPMSFSITSYKEGATPDDGYTVNESNFDKLQELMYGITNIHVDEHVDMQGRPSFWNFKFMVDVMPWADKRWHITAGFYLGSNKIANARNTIEEMPSLLAVNIYNHFYDFAKSGAYWDEPMIPGYDDYYMSPEMAEKLIERGAVGINVGTFSRDIHDNEGNIIYRKGQPYMMRPGTDGLVRAKALVNRFRPYIGFGYNNEVGKSGRLSIGFDAGVMFWGGSPKIVTHEGIDLINDVENVNGKVGDYVDIVNSFKVFPSVNFRISYKLF